jgi:hypothetical protein
MAAESLPGKMFSPKKGKDITIVSYVVPYAIAIIITLAVVGVLVFMNDIHMTETTGAAIVDQQHSNSTNIVLVDKPKEASTVSSTDAGGK